MSNLEFNPDSETANTQSDDSTHPVSSISPLIASITIAAGVFCLIVTVFFGLGVNILYVIFGSNTLGGFEDYLLQHSFFINQIIFFFTVLFVFVAYGGFLSVGIINKWLGSALLLFAGFFVFLETIDWLPNSLLGVNLVPEFLHGNMWILDIPFWIYLILILFLIPFSFFVGNFRTKAIPIWKSLILLVMPALTFLIGIVPNILNIGIRDPTMSWNWFLYSLGMTLWFFFSVIVFSELIRAKVTKFYLWLTLFLSAGAFIVSFFVLTIFSIYVYQNIPDTNTQFINHKERRIT